MKLPVLHRDFYLDRAAVDEKARTIELSFSSELEVKRWFGREILDHGPASVNLSRLNNGAALLVNHNPDDQPGVVESATVGSDRKGRAKVRFGNSARANEIFDDVKNGIRRLVSVGYRIHKMVREKVEEGVETFRAVSWEPLELSFVAVPHDPTVGVGRAFTPNTEQPVIIEPMRLQRDSDPATERGGGALNPPPNPPTAPPVAPPGTITIAEVREAATRAERERQVEIRQIAGQFSAAYPEAGRFAERAIAEGMDIGQFRKEIFNHIKGKPIQTPDVIIGMSDSEVRQYSLLRAMRGMLNGRLEGLEREVSDAYAKRSGQDPKGCWIPIDVINSQWILGDGRQMAQRDLTVGTASLGGNLVNSPLQVDRFIDLLRNRMMVARMGATMLTGLNGDFPIPRQSGSTTAYWVTEQQSTTESNLTIDQITLTPKCVTALQEYSKKLVIQSALDVENLIRNDLVNVLSLALDLAALHGTGTEQPTGIIGVTGIGDVIGGTNGAAPDWADIVNLETEVATDNADVGTLGYLTNAKVRGKLKQTEVASTTGLFVWTDSQSADSPGMGMLNGYRAAVSNQVAGNLTKGTSTTVASAIFFGNWADLLIGQWGAIDLLIDPYTAAATRTFKMYADLYADVAVRHPQSFAAMKDALT